MRILETLTPTQQINILSGNIDGIFTTMFADNDVFKEHHKELCIGYYIYHSADKCISPTFDRFRTMSETPEQLIGQLIRSKFIDKWNRVYDALIVNVYNPLDGKEYSIKKDGANKNTDTYDSTKSKEGTDTDTTTFDTSIEDNGKTGTHEVTTRNISNADDIYGFNSVSPVGDTTSSENSNETFVGDSEKNTTHNIQTKTGTESKNFGINESETHTGTDTKDILIDETETYKGRDVSGAVLINEEIMLRNTQQFYDIVFNDIDSITALQIYI